MAGGWRKLHNEQLHKYTLHQIKSRRMRWPGDVACKGQLGNAYKVLVGTPEGKRPLGKPRRVWEDNTRMHINETG
jgi:hypothetical protein